MPAQLRGKKEGRNNILQNGDKPNNRIIKEYKRKYDNCDKEPQTILSTSICEYVFTRQGGLCDELQLHIWRREERHSL